MLSGSCLLIFVTDVIEFAKMPEIISQKSNYKLHCNEHVAHTHSLYIVTGHNLKCINIGGH